VIKRVTVVQALSGLDRAETLRHWREVHAPLVLRVPGVRRYVQNHCVEDARGGEPPFLGVGEVWFESREGAERAQRTPEWQAVLSDAAGFMDMERVTAGWAEEHEFLPCA
jgi:uncharacterized protein (TIGR02118 family)